LGFLRIDGGSRRDIGLSLTPKSLPQFILGVVLGLMLVAGMLSVLVCFTPLEIQASADSEILAVLGASILVIFALALMEELAFRSYPLFRLRQALGIRPAIYLSSIAFAFYHGLALENLLGPGVWGLFFGWMAISSNSIAPPTGFHFGLNWLQALVGMKPQYGASIWELSIGTEAGSVNVETLGILMQLILLVAGILMVENLIRKNRSVR
jgi:membrane protease YdiL (CAAX protease family)